MQMVIIVSENNILLMLLEAITVIDYCFLSLIIILTD